MNIGDTLQQHTASISKFDEKRAYISLSNISKPIEELIKDYKEGYTADLYARLKCYKGYQMEADLLKRLKDVFKERIGPSFEVVGPDPLIMGHTDFTFDGYPGDCKSILKDEYLPDGNRLPNKVYWQIQADMLYMKKEKGLVIYESRETGLIRSYWVPENKKIHEMIDRKCRMIISQLK